MRNQPTNLQGAPGAPDVGSYGEPEGTLNRFVREENGGVVLEYTLLLVNVFLWVALTIQPFQDALMWFAGKVFEHLHYA